MIHFSLWFWRHYYDIIKFNKKCSMENNHVCFYCEPTFSVNKLLTRILNMYVTYYHALFFFHNVSWTRLICIQYLRNECLEYLYITESTILFVHRSSQKYFMSFLMCLSRYKNTRHYDCMLMVVKKNHFLFREEVHLSSFSIQD